MTIRFLGVLAVLALLPLPIYAQAQEGSDAAVQNKEAPAADAKTEEDSSKKENENGLSPAEQAKQDALTDKVVALTKKLDLNQLQHFTVIYANYMVISMVKAVQNDVGKAVDGCSEHNPSMQNDMKARFTAWQAAVAQPMKEADLNVNNMVLAQTYVSQAEVKEIFALVDETRAKNSSEFEKVPVTTPEACKYMLGKMDETQKSMVQMLQTTLVTYPNMLQKTQE